MNKKFLGIFILFTAVTIGIITVVFKNASEDERLNNPKEVSNSNISAPDKTQVLDAQEESVVSADENIEALTTEPIPNQQVTSSNFWDGWEVETREPPKHITKLSLRVKSGILVDPVNKKVLWEWKSEEAVPIASMSKMMTGYLSMKLLESNSDLGLDSMTKITRNAEKVNGSQVWLATAAPQKIRDLFRASMVKSANDATYALAEAVAPNQEMQKFIALMNREARLMGMRKARFYNVHGLPGRSSKYDNIASCRDLVLLAEELKKDPQIMFWAGMPKTQFVHSNGKVIDLRNTNHALLGKVTGVNGLKTGYTNRAGFCITATAKRGDRELIVVVTGCPDKNIRFQVVRELFEWGFQEKFLQ